MILDRLDFCGRYHRLHPQFAAAFEFLQEEDLSSRPKGRIDLDGDRLYVLFARDPGRPRNDAKLEAHRKYIDIQFMIDGTDHMGWKNTALCREPRMEYDANQDLILYDDEPDIWISTPPGAFVIFFPDDAHAPLVGDGVLHKAVVKVAIE